MARKLLKGTAQADTITGGTVAEQAFASSGNLITHLSPQSATIY